MIRIFIRHCLPGHCASDVPDPCALHQRFEDERAVASQTQKAGVEDEGLQNGIAFGDVESPQFLNLPTRQLQVLALLYSARIRSARARVRSVSVGGMSGRVQFTRPAPGRTLLEISHSLL